MEPDWIKMMGSINSCFEIKDDSTLADAMNNKNFKNSHILFYVRPTPFC